MPFGFRKQQRLTSRYSWKLCLFVALLASWAIFPLQAQPTAKVMTNSGPVIGNQSADLRTFLGIPYASAPIGALRWQPPQPVGRWTTPLQATSFGSVCTQAASDLFDPGSGERIKGSENCLFLNVYAPGSQAPAKGMPVMVWIHGGGFVLGSGSEYDGSVLARKHNVVVVTLNYRLGPLGFLALPSLSAEGGVQKSGNYGLLDQQAAMKWVRDNISVFGGDPGNVTLFGESAGGMSVCAQLTSPAANGLFQKAIIQSGLCGSPNNNVTLASAALRNLNYAAKLGCRLGGLPCLRKLDAGTITKTAVPGIRGLGNLVWSPVYGTPLLPLPLQNAFERGAFARVPVMSGTNHDEGRLFVGLASPDGKPLQLPKYWAGTGLLVGARNNQRVLAQYPVRKFGTPALAFATVFTDAMFSCPALRVDQALARYVPLYAFEFNDPQAVTTLKVPPGLTSLGAFHSSGLVYIFQTPLAGLANPSQFSPAQSELSEQFSAAWANFAISANPSSPGWLPSQPDRINMQTFSPAGSRPNPAFAADHNCSLWSQLNLQ